MSSNDPVHRAAANDVDLTKPRGSGGYPPSDWMTRGTHAYDSANPQASFLRDGIL